MKVLLVEDDPRIAEPLVDGLRAHGHEVDWVTTGTEARAASADGLVLLDLGLPDGDGVDLCRDLRRRTADRPIIVITARGEEDDRVAGLDAGADDYVVKPFGFRELEARMRSVGRRLAPAGDGGVQQLGRLGIDRRGHRVLVDGDEVPLTPKEFSLLTLLADDPGAVVNREVLFDMVWDRDRYGPTRTLDVHVASLRRKLGHPEWIETVRNVGLRLGPTATHR